MAYSEQQMKSALSKLAANWNKNYWLFVAADNVHLMRYSPEGTRELTELGGMSQAAIVHTVNFPADGGDW